MSYVEFRNITKSFGDNVACKNVSLHIQKNSIHSIIGENGAGKSTLVKMLGGIESITSGEIFLQSQSYKPDSAQDAFKNKIAFIHQHFVLAEQLSALDNLVLSASAQEFSLALKKTHQISDQAELLLKKFNWSIPLHKKVHNLSVGEQQRLEILKALMQQPDIIIFDEPTAVLTPQESEDLLHFLVKLRNDGKTIILISHKLNEIKAVSDHISILRSGSLVTSQIAEKLSIDDMAELMIGRHIVKNNQVQRPDLKTVMMKLSGSDIDIYKSEIFGVAGIEGNGQSELIGKLLASFKTNNHIYGDITEDRLKYSVFEEMNLREHLFVRHPDLFTQGFFIDNSVLSQTTQKILDDWDVRPRDINKALIELSGGNQQKFVVGRELLRNPEILLAAHPTRGVDLGAQEKIHNALLEYSQKNKTVILVSSDLAEVLFLSDRFVILNKGKIYGPFAKNQLNEKEIGLLMAGEL